MNNWRDPNSLWGKLSNLIFQRNRERQRGKVWQIWHKNNYNIQNQYEKVYIDSLKPKIQDHCEGGSFISNLDDEFITNSMFADKTLSCVIRNPEDVFRIVTQDD